MFEDWHFWFSIITATVSILALIESCLQKKLSNKQHLFDKRIEVYLIADGLIQLYRTNYNMLNDKEDEPQFAIDLDFLLLTNNTYLEQISLAINNTLNEPYHKQFLMKIESLREVSTKIKFLFTGNTGILLGDFVSYYKELLFSMYQYKILLDKIDEGNQKFHFTLEEMQEKYKERERREELKRAFDNLKQANEILISEDIEGKIKKQIKLLS